MKSISIMGQEEKLVITEPSRLQTIAYGDIFAAVYDSPYVLLHTSGGKVSVHLSLTTLIVHLPEQFVLCNRSTIVNLSKVTSFEKKTGCLCLQNGACYKVSFRKRDEVADRILRSIQ